MSDDSLPAPENQHKPRSIVLEVMQHYQPYDAAKKVLLTVAAYSDTYGPHVFPSMQTLARDSSLSERHVQNCLRALEQQGYLAIIRRKEPGKNARNSYTVLFPWRIPAQKSTEMIPGLPAQKSTEIQSSVYTPLEPKREERSGSTEMNRQIVPEAQPPREQIPITPDKLQWLGLTPGSSVYQASLSGSTDAPDDGTWEEDGSWEELPRVSKDIRWHTQGSGKSYNFWAYP